MDLVFLLTVWQPRTVWFHCLRVAAAMLLRMIKSGYMAFPYAAKPSTANVSSQDAALHNQRHNRSGSGGGAESDPGQKLFVLGPIPPADRATTAEPKLVTAFRHRANHCGATAEAKGDFASND